MTPEPPPYQHPGFSGLAGVARADITPPAGIYCRNWGAAAHDAAEGIHRPLHLTALAISTAEEGAAPLVLIDADLGWWRCLETERAFRRRLLDRLGLEEPRLIFGLSHTHSAPPLAREAEPGWEGGGLLAPYLESVGEAAAAAAAEAIRSRRPARIEWRAGRCGLAAGRDLPDPAGGRRVCGFDPSAPADDTLLVGRVSGEDGVTFAVLANYACHPTTLAWDNRLVSPDYVGAARETIEQGMPGALTLFLQGASGELAPRCQYGGDPAVADAQGRELGHAALSALWGMEPPGSRLAWAGVRESGAPLATWRREAAPLSPELAARNPSVDLPLKEDLPSAVELERELAAAADRVTQERLRRKLNLRRGLGEGRAHAYPVWIWKIGRALLVASMGEAYSRFQQRLRAEFPGHAVVCLNLANGSSGYLPPAELYAEDLYQAWQSPYAPGGLETLETAVAGWLRELA